MRLFQRSKRADGANTSTSSELPKADTTKPDPLKDPVAYSPYRTTVELASAPAPPKSDTPLMANRKTPLRAASVLQADDPQYVPAPIVSLPDIRRPPQPPMAQVSQAPPSNQRYLNAITGPNMQVAPSMPMNEMAANPFGANPDAAGMG